MPLSSITFRLFFCIPFFLSVNRYIFHFSLFLALSFLLSVHLSLSLSVCEYVCLSFYHTHSFISLPPSLFLFHFDSLFTTNSSILSVDHSLSLSLWPTRSKLLCPPLYISCFRVPPKIFIRLFHIHSHLAIKEFSSSHVSGWYLSIWGCIQKLYYLQNLRIFPISLCCITLGLRGLPGTHSS